MDNPEIERALEDLENRMERLRALYEQYFLGIERLEPLVPRKELERRISLLRREQIRNTALRFKFQTLIQRYNSFQQYWGRVARDIDNGTYHRDVIRAAQRFGAKDAMTILGKKQAAKYARLAENQEARRTRNKASFSIDEEEVLADDELLAYDVDDEIEGDEIDVTTEEPPPAKAAPPPPPAAGKAPPPPPAAAKAPPPPPPARASVVPPPPAPPPPQASGAKPPPPQAPGAKPPPPPPINRGSALPPVPAPPGKPLAPPAPKPPLPPPAKASTPQAAPPPAPPSSPEPAAPPKPVEAVKKAQPVNPLLMMRRPAEPPPAAKPAEPAPPAEPAAQARPTAPAPDAAKRRVAELASQVKQAKSQDANAPPAARQSLDLDLEFGGSNPEAKGPQSRRKPSSSKMRAVRPDEPAPSVAAPSSRRRNSSRSMRAVTATPPPEPLNEPQRAEPKRDESPREQPEMHEAASTPEPRVGLGARPAPARPRPSSSGEDLSDARIRQIYAQYVDAKRAAKESTAGVTYEALAKQLRQQAEKLKASHPNKSVDYNVVLKDGKPTLKPTLR